MRKYLSVGEVIPKGYGLAYWMPEYGEGVVYPIPINVLVKISMNLWWLFRRGFFRDWWYTQIRDAERRGFESANKYAVREVFKDIEQNQDTEGYKAMFYVCVDKKTWGQLKQKWICSSL